MQNNSTKTGICDNNNNRKIPTWNTNEREVDNDFHLERGVERETWTIRRRGKFDHRRKPLTCCASLR